MRWKKGSLLGITSLLGLAAGCTSTAAPDSPAPKSTSETRPMCEMPGDRAEMIANVFDLVNDARAAEGLPPLALSGELCEVADGFACEMVEMNFFGHENPETASSPGERLTAAGYIYYAMAENLAIGQTTPEQVVQDWMDSPAHRANILSPEWREIGISVRTGGVHGWYWVQEFADPLLPRASTSLQNG